MHNLKKILAGVLALIMTFGLLACSKDETPAPPTDGQEITETPSASIGTLDLVGTSRLTIYYNAEGKVVTVTDQNGIACHSTLVGTACAEAVSQIIKESEFALTSPFLLIKQNAGSLEPDEQFLQGIVAEAEKVLGDLPMIVSAAADQNAMCYFSAETAKAVLAAYLGNPKDVAYTVVSEAENGYYQISVNSATSFTQYSVGALYGSVEQEFEPTDDIPEEEFQFDDLGLAPNDGDLTEEPSAEG